MSNEQKSVIQKIVDANKDFVKSATDKTQEVSAPAVDYNREIWLIGLGAFSKAREEGTRNFDKLVERGQEFEEHARDMIEEQTAGAKQKIEETFDNVSNPNSTLEDIFDNHVARTIKRLGIPTANTLKSLSEQLLEVSKKLNKISKKEENEEEVEEAKEPATRKNSKVTSKTEEKAAEKNENNK